MMKSITAEIVGTYPRETDEHLISLIRTEVGKYSGSRVWHSLRPFSWMWSNSAVTVVLLITGTDSPINGEFGSTSTDKVPPSSAFP